MRRIFLRILILLGVIIYIFLAGSPVYSGLAFVQRWSRDLPELGDSEKDVSGVAAELQVPFLTEEYFGYTDLTGENLLVLPLKEGVALGGKTYCSYDRLGENLVIREPGQAMLKPLRVSGYPHFAGGYYFVISHDMTGISVVNAEGDTLFSSRFTSLITSLGCGEDLVGLGLLNGEARLFNFRGESIEVLKPGGSRIEAVYGLAVSGKGNFVALTHGIDPQVITLYRSQSGTFRRVKSFTLREALRSQVVMGFSRDELLLFSESLGGFELIRTFEPYTRRGLSVDGSLVDYLFSDDGKQLFVLTRMENTSLLHSFSPEGSLIVREEFQGKATWLREEGHALFLGIDNTLTKIDVIREEL